MARWGVLREHWPLPTGDDVRDALLAAYADPTRGYHDTRHLTEVLARLPSSPTTARTFDRTPVAARRVVPRRRLRRRAGRRGALGHLGRGRPAAAHADPAIVTETARLVRLTETHRPADDDANGCALSDADLGILAAPADRYAEYVTAVRGEYSHLPDEVFAKGRRDVMTDLLAKPRLFHTRLRPRGLGGRRPRQRRGGASATLTGVGAVRRRGAGGPAPAR